MTETIWITRTQPSADESANVWREAGFDPLALPLLDVVPVTHDLVPADNVIIFTSKNGVDHFSGNGQRAICVGDATAARAEAAGFRDVASVDGTSDDITHWILQNLPKEQPIVHISGKHIRGSIVEDLTAAGYPAQRLRVYESQPVERYPDTPFDSIALYSPLAAKTFATVMKNRDTSHLRTFSISEATNAELDSLDLSQRIIADYPNEAALVSAALRH